MKEMRTRNKRLPSTPPTIGAIEKLELWDAVTGVLAATGMDVVLYVEPKELAVEEETLDITPDTDLDDTELTLLSEWVDNAVVFSKTKHERALFNRNVLGDKELTITVVTDDETAVGVAEDN